MISGAFGLAVDSEFPRDISKDVSQGDRDCKLILQTSPRLVGFFCLGECSGALLSVFSVGRNPMRGMHIFSGEAQRKKNAAACFRHFPPKGKTFAKKKDEKKK